MVRNLPANAGDIRDSRFNPWVGKIPCGRKWELTPVSLPGESHGQRRLVGSGPEDGRKLVTTEVTQTTDQLY